MSPVDLHGHADAPAIKDGYSQTPFTLSPIHIKSSIKSAEYGHVKGPVKASGEPTGPFPFHLSGDIRFAPVGIPRGNLTDRSAGREPSKNNVGADRRGQDTESV